MGGRARHRRHDRYGRHKIRSEGNGARLCIVILYNMALIPAAREGDDHWCYRKTNDIDHEGGPILPPCEPTVLVNGKAHARVTDMAYCNGPTDMVVTGSATVKVGGKMATRLKERTMHTGKILPPCSPDTFIGGPSAGISTGNPQAAARHCTGQIQIGNDCGVASALPIVNKVNSTNLTEQQLFDWSLNNDFSSRVTDAAGATNYTKSGMTFPGELADLLSSKNVPAKSTWQTFQGIQKAVAEGKGVISLHWAGRLVNGFSFAMHWVNVTGISYGSNGKPKTVTMMDSSSGSCVLVMDAGDYSWSLVGLGRMVVTESPVW